MRIKKIKFRNYKAFREEQTMLIRPITIIIGKNSSGKSAAARLPLLLGRSFSSEAMAPVEYEFDGLDFGGAFKDMVHNRFEHGSLGFEVEFEDEKGEELTLAAEVQNVVGKPPIQLITNFVFREKRVSFELSLSDHASIKPNITQSVQAIQYKATGSLQGEVSVKFKGLYPVSIEATAEKKINSPDEIQQLLVEWQKKINWLAANINYIGPFRDFPRRSYRYSAGIPRSIGYMGEFAPQLLAQSNYSLEENVGRWFAENLGGWTLEVERGELFTGELFKLLLTSPEDPSVKINIVDVGQGMSQVLPLIVQSYYEKVNNSGIYIIEHPELHLHPAAHGSLASLFVETVNHEKSSYIIETHSENFVLRIRRLVAEGRLAPDDVIIYWVDNDDKPGESKLHEITIYDDGDVSFWPDGVFSEDFEEAVAIRNAQRRQKNLLNNTTI